MDRPPYEEDVTTADPNFIASVLQPNTSAPNLSNDSLRDLESTLRPRSRAASHYRPWDSTSMHRPLDKLRTAYGSESIPLDHPLMPYIPPDTNFVDARHLLRPTDAQSWNWVVGLRNECGPLDVAQAAKQSRSRALRAREGKGLSASRENAGSVAKAAPPPQDISTARFARSTVASHGVTGAPTTWSREPRRHNKTRGNNWAEVGHILASETNTTGSKWALSLCNSRNRHVEPSPPPKYPGVSKPPTHTLRVPGVPSKKKNVRGVRGDGMM